MSPDQSRKQLFKLGTKVLDQKTCKDRCQCSTSRTKIEKIKKFSNPKQMKSQKKDAKILLKKVETAVKKYDNMRKAAMRALDVFNRKSK